MHVNAKASTHLLQIPSEFLCKFDCWIFFREKSYQKQHMHIVIFFLLQKQRRCFYVVVALVMFVYVFEFEFSIMRSLETIYQVLI